MKDGADVIHYHAEGPCVPLRFARSTDIRTVATIHGLDWQRAKWGGLASKYIKFGEATAAKCADALIVLFRGNQEYFKEAYGREATLIPNGITPEADLPAKEISERWGLTRLLCPLPRSHCAREATGTVVGGVQAGKDG
ncbi:MAG: glycosyltransferase family 4 protein [Collinsella sp.]